MKAPRVGVFPPSEALLGLGEVEADQRSPPHLQVVLPVAAQLPLVFAGAEAQSPPALFLHELVWTSRLWASVRKEVEAQDYPPSVHIGLPPELPSSSQLPGGSNRP